MGQCESCEICGDSSDVIEELNHHGQSAWISSHGTCGSEFLRMMAEERLERAEEIADRLRDSFL